MSVDSNNRTKLKVINEDATTQCLTLIDNAIRRNQDTPIVLDVLRRLRSKVRLIGKHGGLSTGQQVMPSNNLTSDNPK